jgi:hypothetical protein
MDTTIPAYAPAAIGLFLLLCVVWVLFRILRAFFRRRPARHDPVMEPAGVSALRQEPRLVADPPASAAPALNGDMAALARSIDRLADQIALIEKRLGGAEARIAVHAPEPGRAATLAPDTVIVPERPV